MVKVKKFVISKGFHDMPKETDLNLVTEELPFIKEGEFLAEAVYLSVDPYMRIYSYKLKKSTTMIGSQVAKIIQSKHKNFPVGKYVIGNFGWQTHTISDGKAAINSELPYLLPDLGNLPVSLALGALGPTGNTAYFGFEVLRAKAGETVVISSAGGAVGNHVGQIAKLKGCCVIGITGSDEKCEWITSIGFDHAINYKTANLRTALAMAAPRGIDCYFDCVGGEISSQIIQHMSKLGRVAVCGSISTYNSDIRNLPKATVIQPSVVYQQLEIKGFVVSEYNSRWMEAFKQNLQWIQEGKIKYKETLTEGFENMPTAFINLLKGINIGKAIVKVQI